MKFTKEHHKIAHARLRQLQRGATPTKRHCGICAEVHFEFWMLGTGCGYEYCEKIFNRLLGSSYDPLGMRGACPWYGKEGQDRRALAGFMADFIEHTYLKGEKL